MPPASAPGSGTAPRLISAAFSGGTATMLRMASWNRSHSVVVLAPYHYNSAASTAVHQ